MSADQKVREEIAQAFGRVERPLRFQPDVGDREFDDYEDLLQSSTVESITRHDLRYGWDPLTSCCGQGVAHFFPAMARIALDPPDEPWEWYGEQMLFHLTYQGQENRFLCFCDIDQRLAVIHLVEHLQQSRKELIDECLAQEQFEECVKLWRSSCE